METKVRFTVTAEHCVRATDELFEMLMRQDRAFKEGGYSGRWQNSLKDRCVFSG
jgi:hypothetical protein